MKFENEFEVHAPVDEVYDALLDVERVAPCMPGAEVLERIDDDSYKVGIKVKLGPIAMKYKGQVEIVEKEPEAKRAVMKVRAKEARGQGMADATAAMSLQESGDVTKGKIETEVQLSGKAASMGQGVIQDVSGTLVKTFADNLAEMLSGGNGAAPDATEEAEPAVESAAAGDEATGDDSLPLGAIGASVVKGRMRDPRAVAGAAIAALLLLLLLLRRRR
jgi:uncharacterized protein